MHYWFIMKRKMPMEKSLPFYIFWLNNTQQMGFHSLLKLYTFAIFFIRQKQISCKSVALSTNQLPLKLQTHISSFDICIGNTNSYLPFAIKRGGGGRVAGFLHIFVTGRVPFLSSNSRDKSD